MTGTMFNTLLAAANVSVETPIDGQTGVWLKYGTTAVSSAMTMTYTTTIGSGREVNNAYVYSRGVLTGANLGYWGNLYVSNGGVAVAPTTLQNGANITVSSGGLVTNPTLRSGHLYLRNGTATDAVVSGGEVQVYYPGTLLSGAVVLSAGTVTISQGSAYNCNFETRVVTAPVYLYGGVMSECVLNSGTVARISAGGTAASCTLNGMNAGNGRARFIVFSGMALSTTISAGGHITVNQPGARGSGNSVLAGGLLDVSSGGIDSGATIYSGGTLTIYSGGIDSGATIYSGGTLTIYSGGTALAVTSNAGAVIIVLAGGSITYV